jgi:ATP-binding cassette subfamily B protein
MRVMCIDDSADTLAARATLLKLEGADVLTFGTGREATAWLEQHGARDWPEVMVCDIALGDEDGHQVVRHLRQIEAERDLQDLVRAVYDLSGRDGRGAAAAVRPPLEESS